VLILPLYSHCPRTPLSPIYHPVSAILSPLYAPSHNRYVLLGSAVPGRQSRGTVGRCARRADQPRRPRQRDLCAPHARPQGGLIANKLLPGGRVFGCFGCVMFALSDDAHVKEATYIAWLPQKTSVGQYEAGYFSPEVSPHLAKAARLMQCTKNCVCVCCNCS